MLSVGRCRLYTVDCVFYVIARGLCMLYCMMPVIGCSLNVVSSMLYVVCCVLCVACCMVCVVCDVVGFMLSVACC